MPKAAIHKHGEPCLPKYEIGATVNWLIPPPACKAMLMEQANHCQFGLKVPFRSNARHYR